MLQVKPIYSAPRNCFGLPEPTENRIYRGHQLRAQRTRNLSPVLRRRLRPRRMRAVVSLLAWVGRYGLGTPRGVCGSGVVLCAGVPFVTGSGGARARGTHTHTHVQVLAER